MADILVLYYSSTGSVADLARQVAEQRRGCRDRVAKMQHLALRIVSILIWSGLVLGATQGPVLGAAGSAEEAPSRSEPAAEGELGINNPGSISEQFRRDTEPRESLFQIPGMARFYDQWANLRSDLAENQGFRPGFKLGQFGGKDGRDVDRVPGDFLVQNVFAGEVFIEQAFGDAGGFGDGTDGCAVEPVLGEQGPGGLDDGLFALGTVHSAGGHDSSFFGC